jgi:hypothetical protein
MLTTAQTVKQVSFAKPGTDGSSLATITSFTPSPSGSWLR